VFGTIRRCNRLASGSRQRRRKVAPGEAPRV